MGPDTGWLVPLTGVVSASGAIWLGKLGRKDSARQTAAAQVLAEREQEFREQRANVEDMRLEADRAHAERDKARVEVERVRVETEHRMAAAQAREDRAQERAEAAQKAAQQYREEVRSLMADLARWRELVVAEIQTEAEHTATVIQAAEDQ